MTVPVLERRWWIRTGVTVPVQVYAAGASPTSKLRRPLCRFVAQLPPLGAATYEMTVAGRHRLRRRRKRPRAAALLAARMTRGRLSDNGQVPQANGNVTLSNAYLELNFSQQQAAPVSIRKAVGISASVDQSFCHYESWGGGAISCDWKMQLASLSQRPQISRQW